MALASPQELTRTDAHPSPVETVEVDLGNVSPLLQVAMCLVMVLAIPVGGLQLVRHVAPRLLPQRLAGLGYAQEIQARVDGAAAQYRQGLVPPDEKLCAVLGFSGGQEGIDIEQLAREDESPVRYLGLCGACDGTMRGLTELVRPLYESDLRPDLVIVAMDPFHLVVREFQPSLARADIKHGVDLRLLQCRRQILRACGVDVDPRYQAQNPWRGMTKNCFEPVPDEVLDFRTEEYGKRGYFDVTAYENSHEQREYLRRLVEESRARGADVLIVLMPIHPVLCDRIPASATLSVYATLQQAFGDDAPPVLDYQQALGAEEFHDVSHLTGAGRATFTSLLARDIRQHCRRDAAHPGGPKRNRGR
jgi:hypothetical protein